VPKVCKDLVTHLLVNASVCEDPRHVPQQALAIAFLETLERCHVLRWALLPHVLNPIDE
jgi:hypothetical protein